MKLSRICLVGVALLAALFLFLQPTLAQVPPLRIMPVGDSITDGSSYSAPTNGPGGGYRRPLWLSLTNAGYTIDYVGVQTVNPAVDVPMPTHHEGHGGWKIDQIYSNMISVVFGATEDPDVLLLMIGTNDFGQNYDLPNATNRMNQLLGLLTTQWPYCKVIVASLTARGAPQEANIQTNFNNSLPGIVSNFQASGKQVYFTDMHSAVPLSDMPDNLHPSTNGYVKMATNWFPAITNVISPLGTTNAPVIARVSQVSGLSNVTVTFSKPVSDETATNLANYLVFGGPTLIGATLESVNKRSVTLTLTPLDLHTTYSVIVTGIQDRTVSATLMPDTFTNFVTYGIAQRGALNNVPEAGNYRLVYSLNIPNAPNYTSGITYDTDLRAYASNFTRVAYYLEIQPTGGELNFAWTSFDAMTTNVNQIGVPVFGSGGNFQMYVTNLNVLSSMPTVLNGTNIPLGNIEFWPSNYQAGNALSMPNASGVNYDWGDTQTAGNYGCMQVHNHAASQVVLAFNHWNSGGAFDLGIGNYPYGANADYTFSNNGPSNTIKLLQVYALLVSNAPPVIASASGSGYSNAVLNFSQPLDDDATNVANYVLSGGLTVFNAALEPLTKQTVTLTTSPQVSTMYTAIVNNVHDRSTTNSLVIATNTTVTFFGPVANGVFNNVSAATNFSLVYSLNISNGAAYNSLGVPYDVAVPQFIGDFTRVAYYLELQTATGLPNFVWVELDPFTTNANLLGVPAGAGSPIFQQFVTNMAVLSSVTSIVQGTNIATGNMEFWPWNYSQNNTNHIPGATSNAYDWGDSVASNTGGHGSMQIHNHGVGQTLFAFNNWGAAAGGTTAVGIGNRPGSADVDWTAAANGSGYTVKTLQVFALPVSNVAPVIASASAFSTTNVILTFSKMLDASTIAFTNFTIPGVTVLSATFDPVSKARVTLLTTPLAPSTLYTARVSNVRDISPAALTIQPNATSVFRSLAGKGVLVNVPEAANYTMVYSLDMPTSANWTAAPVPYSVDNHLGMPDYSRIAYYIELQTNNGTPTFLWVTMDPFTQDAGKIGVPTYASGAVFQQRISNMTVFSSAAGVANVTNFSGGNIEFWPSTYTANNSAGITNASNSAYDWGDQPTAGNYGSMQIHNSAASHVVFAFNHWNAGTVDLGIGTDPNLSRGNYNPDWTFAVNAGIYTSKVLQVFVLPYPDTNAPTIVSAVASLDRSSVLVKFSEPLTDASAALGNFSIDNGIVVSSAVLTSNLDYVLLSVSQLAGGTCTLTVNNVRDRSPNATAIAPNSTAVITFPPLPAQITASVPEAANYQLLYYLDVPVSSPGWNTTGTTYAIDNRNTVGPFSRVAYFVELATNAGPTNWVYVSVDAFSTDVNKLGVPDLLSGALFQQKLTNMNVYSSQTNITAGTGIATGNIEFWPQNFAVANGAAVPNASGTTFDWGDTVSTIFGTGGHGSMQIHNGAVSNVLFAYNAWGSARTSEMGIGSQPAGGINGNPDWTSTANAGIYSIRHIYVLVLPTSSTNGPVALRAQGYQGRTNVLVTFNEIMSDASASPAKFAISGGSLAVTAATLQPNLHDILLTTAPQTPGSNYTITISNVTDRTTNGYSIAAGASVNFTAIPSLSLFATVPEATNYTLVYGLNLPGAVPNYGTNSVPYGIDQRPLITQAYTRVAYYMELATNNGPTNWVYISDDAFTTDIRFIGVPVWNLGRNYQQKIATNATIWSSDTNIITGTGIGTCNIEFYPWNYSAASNAVNPTGSDTLYDWNDTFSTAGQYGAMQIHNYGALVGGGVSTGQVLFAFNHWGSGQSGFTDIGIGSRPTSHPDYTTSQNGTNYTTKNLYVLVLLTNTPAVAPSTNVIAPTIVLHPSSRTNLFNTTNAIGAIATGTTPAFQWRQNGTPLAGQTNSWIAFEGLALTNGGNYDVTASNSAGVVTSIVAVLVVNRLPVAGPDLFGALQNIPVTRPLAFLLANDNDPDLDAIQIAALGPNTLNAGTSTNSSVTEFTYTPPLNFTGSDSFNYVLGDGRGGSVTALVTVIVMTNHTPELSASGVVSSNGIIRFTGAGVSNGLYTVERTTDLLGGSWFFFTNVPANGNGTFIIDDGTFPRPTNRFFRVLVP